MNKKPNIIYFVGDQMRCDSLHHMGCEASITPNLDAILEEGISFENAYCQNPVCVPSRCSFLTGLYPHTTGHRTMHYLQDENEPNFLCTMKNNGYEVIWVGRNDVIPGNRSKAEYCDVYFDGKTYTNSNDVKSKGIHFKPGNKENIDVSKAGYYSHYIGKISEEQAHITGFMNDWMCVESALRYLEERKSEKPFFLYLTISYPHPPYACEDPWYSSIDRSKIEPKRPSALELDKPAMLKGIAKNQNLEEWLKDNYTEMKATYLAMVSRFDYQYGLLKNKLQELDLYDNSSIFVFADHGDYTGDYSIAEKVQNCFEDPISNIPLLIKPAKQFACKPRQTKALAELVDLCETVCDMSGIKTEYTQFGKSLLPVIAGEEEHKDAVICEGGRIHGETQAMERGHDKESTYWPRLHEQEKEGPQHTKAIMLREKRYKYIYRLYEKDELYDLEKDPKEISNLIDNCEYVELISQLKNRLLDFMVSTGDFVPNRKDPR